MRMDTSVVLISLLVVVSQGGDTSTNQTSLSSLNSLERNVSSSEEKFNESVENQQSFRYGDESTLTNRPRATGFEVRMGNSRFRPLRPAGFSVPKREENHYIHDVANLKKYDQVRNGIDIMAMYKQDVGPDYGFSLDDDSNPPQDVVSVDDGEIYETESGGHGRVQDGRRPNVVVKGHSFNAVAVGFLVYLILLTVLQNSIFNITRRRPAGLNLGVGVGVGAGPAGPLRESR